MGRLIILLLIVIAVVWLVRRALSPPASRRTDSSGDDAAGGRLVRCAHCGMYLPDAEAKRAAGTAYCTEEHARLGPGKS